MSLQDNREYRISPRSSHATEHSVPFSDLRATLDVRHMRLWLATEIEDPTTWGALDIARGGLSIVREFEAAPHNHTHRNTELLKRMSVSAFTLYQPNRITDDDGNLAAFVLPRNAYLQLGQMPESHFDALRGSSLAPNHVTIHVDDNDMLGIEANDPDSFPQIEVINSDDETAVEIGSTTRNYLSPRDIGSGYVTRADHITVLKPLNERYAYVPPRPEANVSTPEHTGHRSHDS